MMDVLIILGIAISIPLIGFGWLVSVFYRDIRKERRT